MKKLYKLLYAILRMRAFVSVRDTEWARKFQRYMQTPPVVVELEELMRCTATQFSALVTKYPEEMHFIVSVGQKSDVGMFFPFLSDDQLRKILRNYAAWGIPEFKSPLEEQVARFLVRRVKEGDSLDARVSFMKSFYDRRLSILVTTVPGLTEEGDRQLRMEAQRYS